MDQHVIHALSPSLRKHASMMRMLHRESVTGAEKDDLPANCRGKWIRLFRELSQGVSQLPEIFGTYPAKFASPEQVSSNP